MGASVTAQDRGAPAGEAHHFLSTIFLEKELERVPPWCVRAVPLLPADRADLSCKLTPADPLLGARSQDTDTGQLATGDRVRRPWRLEG